MSQTLNVRALNMLMGRIIAEQDSRVGAVANGAAESFDDYKYRIGFLRGLELARTLCEGVENDLQKGTSK